MHRSQQHLQGAYATKISYTSQIDSAKSKVTAGFGAACDSNIVHGNSEFNSQNFMATNPQENSNSLEGNTSMDESAECRFDDIEDPFKDMVVTNVFIEEDDKERLPDFFNPDNVKHIKRQDCYLCHEPLGKIHVKKSKQKHYCTYCGKTVCKYCCQNKRVLSKADQKLYSVCDMCDHVLSNLLFKENIKNDIQRKKDTCDELSQGIKMLDSKILKLNKLKKEQAKFSKKRQEEIQQQDNHYTDIIKEQRNKNKDVHRDILENEQKIEQIDSQIAEKQAQLQKRRNHLAEIKKRHNNLEQEIEVSKAEFKDHDSFLKLHMKSEMDCVFVKQEIVDSDVDQRLVQKWRDNDQSQTMEDNTVDMMSLEMDMDAYRTNDSQVLPKTQTNSKIESNWARSANDLNQNNKVEMPEKVMKSNSNYMQRPRVQKN